MDDSDDPRLPPCPEHLENQCQEAEDRGLDPGASNVIGPALQEGEASCSICLSILGTQEIGNPNTCNHEFCLECIIQWSKERNICPVDRQQFSSLRVLVNGEHNRSISVENRNAALTSAADYILDLLLPPSFNLALPDYHDSNLHEEAMDSEHDELDVATTFFLAEAYIDVLVETYHEEDINENLMGLIGGEGAVTASARARPFRLRKPSSLRPLIPLSLWRRNQRITKPGGDTKRRKRYSGIDVRNADFQVKETAKSKGNQNKDSREGSYNAREYPSFNMPPPPVSGPVEAPSFSDFLMSSSEDFDNNGDLFVNNHPPPPPVLGSFRRPGTEEEKETEENKGDSINLYGEMELGETGHTELLTGETSKSDEEARGMMEMLGHLYVDEDEDAQPGTLAAAAAAPILELPPPLPPPPLPPLHEGLLLNLSEDKAADIPLPKPPDPPKLLLLEEPPRPPDILSRIIEDCKPKTTGEEIYEPDSPTEEDDDIQPNTVSSVLIPEEEEQHQEEETTYGPSLPPKGFSFIVGNTPPPLPPLPPTISAPELVDDSSEDVPLILKDTATNRPITVEDSDNESDDLTVIENTPKEAEPGSPMSPKGSPSHIPLPSLTDVPIPDDGNAPMIDEGGSNSQKGNPEAPVKFSLNLRSSVRSICNPLASVDNEARKARKIEKQAMDPVELAKSRTEMALAIANKFVAQQQAAEGRLHTLVLPPSASKDTKETKRKKKEKEEEDKRSEKMSDNEEPDAEANQSKETVEEEMPVTEEQVEPMEVVDTNQENECENIPLPDFPPQIEYGPEPPAPAKDNDKASPNSPPEITEIVAEEPVAEGMQQDMDIPVPEIAPATEDIESPDINKQTESAPPVVKDLADLEGLGTEDISDTNEDDNVVLQGLGTEAISDSNENFSDASNMEEGELAADPVPHVDKFGFMTHSGGVRSHVAGGDFEEGEIVEENRSKKKKRRSKRKDKAKDSSASPSHKGNDARSDDEGLTELTEKTLTAGITDTGENLDASWKKPSKISKDRHYRDPKQHSTHDRAEYTDDDLMDKRRDKKRDMERYDVRKVVKEKLRKDTDEFGRDVRRRSRSRYRSRSRSRRRHRYRSYSSSYTRNYSSSYSRSPSYSRSRDRGRKAKKRRIVKDKYRGGSRRSREKKKTRASPVRRRKQRSITPVKPKAKLREKAKNKLKRLPVEPKKKKKKSKLEDKTKKKEKTKKKKLRSPINSKEIFATDDNIYVSLTLDRPFGKENKENKASKKRKLKSKSPEKVTKKKQKRDTTPKPKPLSEKAQRRQKVISAPSKSKTPELPSHISIPVAGSPPWERRPSPPSSRSSPAHSRSRSWSVHSRSRSRSIVRRHVERPGRGRRVFRRRTNPNNPVEFIDLALLPSDEERDDDVIIVENDLMYMYGDDHGDLTNIPMPHEGSDRESSASPNEPEIRNTIPWHVPVEPPVEPPVRFSLFSRPSTLQRIQNPLASPDRPHRGPHTPPEPDQADSNAAEAYDPFEPTKSPSQSPTNVPSGLGSELLPPPMPPPSLGLPSIHTNLFPIMQHETASTREPVSREPAPREKTPSSKIKIKRPSEKSRSPDRRDDRRSPEREIEYRRRHSPEKERRRKERKRKSPEQSESRRRHKLTPEREERPEKERVERSNKSPLRDDHHIQNEVQVERIPVEVVPVVESRRVTEPEPPLICDVEEDDDVVEAEVVTVISPKTVEQSGKDIEEIQEITPAKEPEENASQPVVVEESDVLPGSPEVQMMSVQPRSKSIKTTPTAAAPASAPQVNGRPEEGSPYSPTAPQDTPTQKGGNAAQKEDLASALKNVQELMKVAKESIMQNLSRTSRSKPVSSPLSDGSAPSPVDSPPVVPRAAVAPKTAKSHRKPHSSPLAGDSPPSPDASFSPGSPPGTPPSPEESPDLNLPDDSSSGAHPRQSLEDRFVSLFGSSGKGKRPNKSAAKPVKSPEKKKKGPAPIEAKKSSAKVLSIPEERLQVLDDVPSSAVELQVKSKFLKKLNRQERVVEEVKLALKPLYMKKTVDKTMYKDIMRKAVPKICHNKSGEINPKKVRALVNGYVKKFKYQKEKDLKQQKARLGLG